MCVGGDSVVLTCPRSELGSGWADGDGEIVRERGSMHHKATETSERIDLDLEGMRKKQPVHIRGTIHNPFARSGLWLRGTLHCHVDQPGKPQWQREAIPHYRALGYDFIAGMDHDRIVPLESASDLLVVPGVEISGPDHFLAFDIDELPEYEREGERIHRTATMVSRVKEMGGIAFLAHPFKTGFSWSELHMLCDAGLDGVEVVNSNVRSGGADAGRCDQIWHNLMREGRILSVVGNDDAHGPHEDPERLGPDGVSHAAWTGLLVEQFSTEAVLNALRAGRSYASEGPELLDLAFHDDGRLHVACSPCVACHVRSVGGNWGGASVHPEPGHSTAEHFVFDFTENGYRIVDYLVVILQDAVGRRAWTSPIRADLTITPRRA